MGYLSTYGVDLKKSSFSFLNEEELTPLIEKIASKKIVMLGESSHGTHEFYRWRRLISQELIANHGFDFIAVEGDWPACQKINQFINGKDKINAREVLSHFTRWPTWMWANTDMIELVDWLYSQNCDFERSVGFHGLDVYSLYESMDEVVRKLESNWPDLAGMAREFYSCMNAFGRDEMTYARSLFKAPEGCKQEIINTLQELMGQKISAGEQKQVYFDVVQNAKIVKNAESYYRAMVFGEDNSWNVRDHHMMDTLESLLEYYGPDTKGIVWAHNTHIGDYRATDMELRGEVNLGGLAREMYGNKDVALVGFGTYSGTVIASHGWDGPIQVLDLPVAKSGSVEEEFHKLCLEIGAANLLTFLTWPEPHSVLSQVKGHRAVGVVYDPSGDSRRNYVPTILNKRYDAFIFCDETKALTPLKVDIDTKKFPETYPYGSQI